MTPIELLKDRLEEISNCIKNAYNNDVDQEEIKKLTEVYNQYYTSLQLLNTFTGINFYFTKLIHTKNNKLTYKTVLFSKHVNSIKIKERKMLKQ